MASKSSLLVSATFVATFIVIIFFNFDAALANDIPTRDVLRCMVCKAFVDEAEAEIEKIDPHKKVDVGSFRLDGKGNVKQNLVPYARSELHLSDLMDRICSAGMKDYVLANYKDSGRPTLLRITTFDGNMNPDMSKVDLAPNPEVNDRIASYCNSLVEDYEDEIIAMFAKSSKQPHKQLCLTTAKVCPESAVPDDDNSNDDDSQSADGYDFEREEL